MKKVCILLGVLLIVMLSLTAWAKDAVVAAVSNPLPNPPGAIIMENGTHYSRGTYAIGTIQLYYTVTATQFTAGCNHSFDVALNYQDNGKGKPSKYPLDLNFRQTGSANLSLQPTQSGYSGITRASFPLYATVNICVPADVANDPVFQVDGTDLVGNLQLETVPKGANLDTVTTIQVHLILIHPSDDACLRVLNFVTNNDITSALSSITVRKAAVPAAMPVGSTPSQLNYIVVVANTCSETHCIDLSFALDAAFQLGSGTNPVKSFSSNDVLDEFQDVATFWLTAPTATNQGTNTCLYSTAGCFSIPATDTFMLKADITIKSNASWPPPAQYTGFGASIWEPNVTCGNPPSGTLYSVADPNPVNVTLNVVCNDVPPQSVSCTPS